MIRNAGRRASIPMQMEVVMADPDKIGSTSSGSGGDEAKAQIRHTADKARHEATRVMDEAKERGQDMLAEQRQSAAGQLDGVANALRQTAQQLNRQNQPKLAEYAEWTAGCVEGCARTIRERDAGEMVDQVQDFARRQPGLFLGGAVVAGLLAARFMRSSEERRYDYTGATAEDDSPKPFPRDPTINDPGISNPDPLVNPVKTPGGDLNAR